MTEILFLSYSPAEACSYYRCAGVIKDLQKKLGHNASITLQRWDQGEPNWATLNRFDIVMIQRPCTTDVLRLVQYLKAMGIKTWLDYDDDLFHVNPENKTWLQYAMPTAQNAMKEMIQIADVITVPTEYLRQVLYQLNGNVVVIPNAFNDSMHPRPEPNKRNNIALWRGTDHHIRDLMTYKDAISRATYYFKDTKFTFVGGMNPSWFIDNSKSNIDIIGGLDVVPYFEMLADKAPILVHVPLHDNIFNRCKSNIAAIEGSYAGAACLVPEWWNFPGTITYNDGESYFEGMRSVLSGEVDVEAAARVAWEYVMDVLRLSVVNVERVQVINSL